VTRPDASRAGRLARDLEHKLALIEDRPESVLTWSDVARHVRNFIRRFAAALSLRYKLADASSQASRRRNLGVLGVSGLMSVNGRTSVLRWHV